MGHIHAFARFGGLHARTADAMLARSDEDNSPYSQGRSTIADFWIIKHATRIQAFFAIPGPSFVNGSRQRSGGKSFLARYELIVPTCPGAGSLGPSEPVRRQIIERAAIMSRAPASNVAGHFSAADQRDWVFQSCTPYAQRLARRAKRYKPESGYYGIKMR